MTPEPTDRIALVLLNQRGMEIARKIQTALPVAQVYGLASRVDGADTVFDNTTETLCNLYRSGTSIIGFCATGILIRALAPELSNKRAEPPVVAMSDDGSAIVPLLGGLTGANELAQTLAGITGGTATVTASGARQFGLQLEAPPSGYTLANPEDAKTITSDLLAGKTARLIGKASFLTDSTLPFSPDGDIPIHVTVYSDQHSGLVYHPHSIVAVPKNEQNGSDDSVHAACLALNIAPASVATILFPEGLDPTFQTVRAIRYGDVPDNWKLHGNHNDLAFYEAPTPEALQTTGRAHGHLAVVGVGPGDRGYLTADARDALDHADDLVGYDTYLSLVPDTNPDQIRHASGNRVEIERAEQALDLAVQGRRVALVTSGDPGIFAMASAVMEALEAKPGHWTGLDVTVIPGISAMQTAAAKIGAPIGHDFCTISLSDIRKPWKIVAKRLQAAAEADFVIALYNPASKTRREQIHQTKQVLLDIHAPEVPVILGRNLGRSGESIEVTTLGTFDPDTIDMRTVLVIGSSRTRVFEGPGGKQLVYTPRTYETD